MARGISIAALVLSILLPVVGLILGIIALRQERQAGENGTMAIVAIVIGAIGTVILAFVAIVASIAAFGVSNPDRYVQEGCFGHAAGLACTSNAVQVNAGQNTIAFQLQNGAGERITVTDVSSTGDCSSVGSATFDGTALPVTYFPNDEFIVTVSCDSVPEGVTFQDEFVFTYDVVDGLSQLTTSVEVVVKT